MKLKYQLALLTVAAILIVVPLLFRRRAPSFVKEFFGTPTEAVNLAVFRIIFLLLVIYFYFTLNVSWYARLPGELMAPPPGLGWLTGYLPLTEGLTRTASILFLVFCVTGLIGLFTRTSLVLGLIFGIYVLGLPQLFGKINHYHHLLWFMVILAISPCADMLSCDALISAWKRADNGVIEPPKPALVYSLPLRFIWLLMGAIYLSSGFWKVWTGGFGWVFGDNLRNIMYNEWMGYGDWKPIFRLDLYPPLYKFAALVTILFELSFIILIFFPLLRRLAVTGGVIFHNLINLMTRINFYPLYICYASFVNWHWLFRQAGRRLFRGELMVVYDGNCKLCRRTIASLRTLDVLERVRYVNQFEADALAAAAARGVSADQLARDLYAFRGEKAWAGFEAYRVMAARLPPLWPLLPFLYVWPVPLIAERLYRRVADHRACEIIDGNRNAINVSKALPNRSRVRAVVIVGSLLLYAYGLSAVVKFNSWPMAMYPTFEDLDEPEVSVITMMIGLPSGQVIERRPTGETFHIAPERLMGLFNSIFAVEDSLERQRRLEALWKIWVKDNPDFRNAVFVRFYKDVLSSLPENRGQPPISRELLAELSLNLRDSAAP